MINVIQISIEGYVQEQNAHYINTILGLYVITLTRTTPNQKLHTDDAQDFCHNLIFIHNSIKN